MTEETIIIYHRLLDVAIIRFVNDSSIHRHAFSGEPFCFKIGHGEVIQGWDEGLLKMSKGQRARLLIPSSHGYGAEGAKIV